MEAFPSTYVFRCCLKHAPVASVRARVINRPARPRSRPRSPCFSPAVDSGREVTTEVFLASPPAVSTKSALFIAWGQLLTYDLALTSDNASEPFDVPCNEGEKKEVEADVPCRLLPCAFFGVSQGGGSQPVSRSPRVWLCC